ncbi:unnamed protein product [Cylindrotheca closterium]|uniref:Uncharacterized protein n=1 Tax=Cylindrotheca closterium TaxID=2856 RepID=A0AAD2G7K2_9STRA|nr:unnamed protein product [Cylindrotheca closterium]
MEEQDEMQRKSATEKKKEKEDRNKKRNRQRREERLKEEEAVLMKQKETTVAYLANKVASKRGIVANLCYPTILRYPTIPSVDTFNAKQVKKKKALQVQNE